MRKIGILVTALLMIMLTGCGVNIRQEGNKIYTDASRDEAYTFTEAALKTKGYKITEGSKINYYINATPEYNETFKIEKADKRELNATIAEKNNETVVALVALANGDIDKDASERIAADAVKEIIAELDLYGKFTASSEKSLTYPVATVAQLKTFIKDYATKANLNPADTDTGLTVKESTSNSPFNSPLEGSIKIVADETSKVVVTVKAEVKGNYDVRGNQTYADAFTQKIIDALNEYPVVEKALRSAYKYVTLDTAVNNAANAIKDSGFTITQTDKRNGLISAVKNKINLAVTFTNINDSIAINCEAFKEGAAGESKATLTTAVTQELENVVLNLEKYQTTLSSTKLLIGTNQDQIVKVLKRALASYAYTAQYNSADGVIKAVNQDNKAKAHVITLNNMGGEGISVEIFTLYNTKSSEAKRIVKLENDKILRALGSLDKTDLK
jgi:hypothetical protein